MFSSHDLDRKKRTRHIVDTLFSSHDLDLKKGTCYLVQFTQSGSEEPVTIRLPCSVCTIWISIKHTQKRTQYPTLFISCNLDVKKRTQYLVWIWTNGRKDLSRGMERTGDSATQTYHVPSAVLFFNTIIIECRDLLVELRRSYCAVCTCAICLNSDGKVELFSSDLRHHSCAKMYMNTKRDSLSAPLSLYATFCIDLYTN